MNSRPVPSRALVISTGLDRPFAIGVSVIVEGDGALRVTPPSVSGLAPAEADARVGARPASSAAATAAPTTARVRTERGATAMGMVIKCIPAASD